MTYEAKVVIPIEISLPSMRTMGFSPSGNDMIMIEQLDLLEEIREITSIRLAEY